MVEFFIKYWLEFLFGLVAAGLGLLCKKFRNLYIAEQKRQKSKEWEALREDIKETIKKVGEESLEGDKRLQAQINVVTNGILYLQGRTFKHECRELLREDREITLAEFEAIQESYDTYKSLGGNHDGDSLYEMVKTKATNSLTD